MRDQLDVGVRLRQKVRLDSQSVLCSSVRYSSRTTKRRPYEVHVSKRCSPKFAPDGQYIYSVRKQSLQLDFIESDNVQNQ